MLGPFKYGDTQFLFQTYDMTTQGWLSQVEVSCRLCEVKRLGQIDNFFENLDFRSYPLLAATLISKKQELR